MGINLMAVLAATVGQFLFGAIWYGPVFGKLWGKIHGFDKLPKAKQQELMAKMGPTYILQFLVTVLTSFVLAKLLVLLPTYSVYAIAMWVWAGFVVPTQVSGALFSRVEDEWKLKLVAVQASGSLGYLLLAAAILHYLT